MIIVTDDEDRENEGDLIMAAEKVTPETVNFMTKYGRGLICVPTTESRLKTLGIGRMVAENRESFKTDFMVSVDARNGITTGISAPDRARSIRVLADPNSVPADLVSPGHIFPLQAREGGVLRRSAGYHRSLRRPRKDGRTVSPSAVLCEILNESDVHHGAAARPDEICKGTIWAEDLHHSRFHRVSPRPREACLERAGGACSQPHMVTSNCISTARWWTANIMPRW